MDETELQRWAEEAVWAMLESIAVACVQGEWL